MMNFKADLYIEKLLDFGVHNQLLETHDRPQVRNQLLELLKVTEPFSRDYEALPVEALTKILEHLLDYAVSIGIINGSITERDLLDAKIMAQLLPRQSELYRNFKEIEKTEGRIAATDYFYRLCQNSNYIRMDRISKNMNWLTKTDYGDLEITINLSKPEKDPAEIAAEKNMPVANYPKCLLCLENVGYAGRLNHPGRSNHRVIPITLEGENWYFQYSPYVYYNEHAIIFSEIHRPMAISRATFVRLLDFVELYPHYFIGSNADLPIVGGSILSHDHFQGGHHVFPMEKAEILKTFHNSNFPNTQLKILKWPLSVIRLSSKSKDEVIELSDRILKVWRGYSDAGVNVIYHTEDTPHNTITPIARINIDSEWEIDLTLRNNRTSEAYPDGIFHPHQYLHHIKKENIGLIEVMGLAVLPPRLKEEMSSIQRILVGEMNLEKALEDEALIKHEPWIRDMVDQYGLHQTQTQAETLLRDEVGRKFTQVLECSGVFKQTREGLEAFEKFIQICAKL